METAGGVDLRLRNHPIRRPLVFGKYYIVKGADRQTADIIVAHNITRSYLSTVPGSL